MDNRIFTLKDIVSLVKPIAEKYKVKEIYLFGSYARGEADGDSDLDFLVFGGENFKLTMIFLDEERLIISMNEREAAGSMKHTDQQRIQKIYEKSVELYEYIVRHQIKKEHLLAEIPLQWLVTTPLYNIGENVYNLSKEYKDKHNEIQWAMIAGLRHRLVHDYDGTNWNIIADVVFEELPVLIEQLKKLM